MRAAGDRLPRGPLRSPVVVALGLAAAAVLGGYLAASLALFAVALATAGGRATIHVTAGEAGIVLLVLAAASVAPRAAARLRRKSRQIRGRTVVRAARVAAGHVGPEERIAVGAGRGPWILGRRGVAGVDAPVPTDASGAVARLTRLGHAWHVDAVGPHHVYGEDGMPRRSMRLGPDGWVRVADVRLRLGVRGGGAVKRRASTAPAVESAPPAAVRGARRRGWVRVERADGTLVAGRVARAQGMLARAWGLLGRRALRVSEGLWIEPCNAVHALGMRMAVDAVYLAEDGTVLALVAPLRPWRLGPFVRGARAVLEVGEGVASACGVQVGERLRVVGQEPSASASGEPRPPVGERGAQTGRAAGRPQL